MSYGHNVLYHMGDGLLQKSVGSLDEMSCDTLTILLPYQLNADKNVAVKTGKQFMYSEIICLIICGTFR